MPVNFQQIQTQVNGLGQQALQQEKMLQTRREQALALLHRYADQLDLLSALVERAARENPNLRCARPGTEPLTLAEPSPELTQEIVILAADGSQIEPDRHAAVEFGVINTGAFRIQPNQPIPPTEIIESQLLFGEDLIEDGIQFTEEIVALKRDLEERKLLLTLATDEKLPVVTLTDGPLELFREKESGAAKLYQKYFKEYLTALEQLSTLSAVTAGYVDRPRADLVVRLLELTQIAAGDFAQKVGREHPLQGVTDASLYRDLLGPGDRSPVFSIQSPSAQEFKGLLALHFFYLNVGRENQPSIARIEIPAWVAQHPSLLNLLHAALINQCQVTGGHAFPYALHRAHEVAVVTYAEKEQLENLIIKKMIEHGLLPPQVSNKQYLKNNFGKRTRYR